MVSDICVDYGLILFWLIEIIWELIWENLFFSVCVIVVFENFIDLIGSVVDDDFVVVVNSLSSLLEVDSVILFLLFYLFGISLDLGVWFSYVFCW